MKTSQLVGAIVALAAMVFVITFAMNYLGRAPQGTTPVGEEVGSLEFLEKNFPPARPGDLTGVCCELGRRGGHDFWFFNPHDQAVKVGLMRKNCTCSSIQFVVVPPKALPRLTAAYAGHAVALGTDPLARLTAYLGFGGALAERTTAGLTRVEMFEDNEVVVPPHAVGWFRLGWDGRRLETQSLHAMFWVGDPASTPIVLQAYVAVVPPVRYLGGIDVPARQTEDLPVSVEIVCWSPTRMSFDIDAAVANPRGGRPESDPLVVGEPIPLSDWERAELERTLNASTFIGPVRSGYKVPVTLQQYSKDGKTPFEIGVFHRLVRLSSPDEGIPEEHVSIQGSVTGDVRVEGGDGGRLVFGTFPRTRGSKTLTLLLRTEVPGLRITVDRERTPDFVELTLPEKPEARGNEWVWRVEARVPPDKARGPFPRSEDPRYQDSALYFQTAGDKPRTIRVPVSGTANEG